MSFRDTENFSQFSRLGAYFKLNPQEFTLIRQTFVLFRADQPETGLIILKLLVFLCVIICINCYIFVT